MAAPCASNIATKEKYKDLEIDTTRMWDLNATKISKTSFYTHFMCGKPDFQLSTHFLTQRKTHQHKDVFKHVLRTNP